MGTFIGANKPVKSVVLGKGQETKVVGVIVAEIGMVGLRLLEDARLVLARLARRAAADCRMANYRHPRPAAVGVWTPLTASTAAASTRWHQRSGGPGYATLPDRL